ncbi:transcription elongation factor GreB [Neisseria meningitidis]|nr:transcription elongation factor GreB [Neisseria meningitidis]
MSTETKNYITPAGWQALKDELYQLVNKERPEIVQISTGRQATATAAKTATTFTANAVCAKSTAASVS